MPLETGTFSSREKLEWWVTWMLKRTKNSPQQIADHCGISLETVLEIKSRTPSNNAIENCLRSMAEGQICQCGDHKVKINLDNVS